MKTLIKTAIALLLFGCLFKMPYSYYQMTRFVAFAGFIAIAYIYYEAKQYYGTIIGVIGLIIFNPIYKLTFKRNAWQTIDIILGSLLLLWGIIDIIISLNKQKHANNI